MLTELFVDDNMGTAQLEDMQEDVCSEELSKEKACQNEEPLPITPEVKVSFSCCLLTSKM